MRGAPTNDGNIRSEFYLRFREANGSVMRPECGSWKHRLFDGAAEAVVGYVGGMGGSSRPGTNLNDRHDYHRRDP